MFTPSTRQQPISLGNETFDDFLGGGLLNRSLNLFERQGPTSKLLDAVWTKSFASSTLSTKNNLLLINFNASDQIQTEQFLSGLPVPRKIKTENLYKDVRGKSATAQIKIAWRYSSRSASPADKMAETRQVDFGLHLTKELDPEKLGKVAIINVDPDDGSLKLGCLLSQIETEVRDLLKSSDQTTVTQATIPQVNIIVKDLLHPMSPMIDQPQNLLKFLYMLRCQVRTLDKGCILVTYDIDMCLNHSILKQSIYNMADCVVSFFTYETGQNVLLGYKHTDGTLDYVKVPKINSFGMHFQRELSDWGYRFTKNHRYFVVDELSLPPTHDDEEKGVSNLTRKQSASELTDVGYREKKLEQVGPLDELKEVAAMIGKR